MVATEVQHVLIGLGRQVAVLRRLDHETVAASGLTLTGRELAVLALVAAGQSTRVVARRLCCAPRTIEKHLERIYRKLGVRDRLNAVLIARQHGLL